mmetsp:Transcript_24776/g.46291  ORF Transcript_24776/g.46291 Transcript_24776/m.46291 type:complete len:242 (-) Transcript_24776:24-749(-)
MIVLFGLLLGWVLLVSFIVGVLAGQGTLSVFLWIGGTLPWMFDMPYIIEVIAYFLTLKPKKLEFGDWKAMDHWVLPMDIDFNSHMNNAKYNRKFEFTRYEYLKQSGMIRVMKDMNIKWGFKSNIVRFRREVRAFTRIKLMTRLAGWDERNFYMEHKMVTGGGNGSGQGSDGGNDTKEQGEDEFVNSYNIAMFTFKRTCPVKPAEMVRAVFPAKTDLPDVYMPPVIEQYAALEKACSDELKK